MQKLKLSQIQTDKIQQILIEENKLKGEYEKLTNRKNDMVELILDAQAMTPEQLSKIKSYSFVGGDNGEMYIQLVEVGDTQETGPAVMEAEPAEKPPAKKKK